MVFRNNQQNSELVELNGIIYKVIYLKPIYIVALIIERGEHHGLFYLRPTG